MAWRRSVCFRELVKEFLEEGREGELLGRGGRRSCWRKERR